MKNTPLIQVGAATVTSIRELDASEVIHSIIPDATQENVRSIPWLFPYFADEQGNLRAQNQSFLIEVNGKRIIVDTCVGNGRNRPELPAWNNLQTSYLQSLLEADCTPEAVDILICTHLHFDHVGWNTNFQNGQWVPTFPNACYIFVKEEVDYWMTKPGKEIADDLNGIEDAVKPVIEAGLVDLVSSTHKITDEISLIPTPGHTPHHVSVLIESKGQSAILTGDVFHHPCQIARPEWMSFDTDKQLALATRKSLLETYANKETMLIGAHFASPYGGVLKKDDVGFSLAEVTD